MEFDIKHLQALLKLCRKQGVTEIKMNGIELKLGDLPVENKSTGQVQDEIESDNPYANFPDGILTPEQLMYYSSGGLPENDPHAKDGAQQ